MTEVAFVLDSAEIQRRAYNLRCAAQAARGSDRDIFAEKIAITCERTAEWLLELDSRATDTCGGSG